MARDVRNTMVFASIFCTVSGFSTYDLKCNTWDKVKRFYCACIAFALFVFPVIHIVMRLCDLTVNYVSVISLLLDCAVTVTLTYYRVKFIVYKRSVRNILNNLNYINKRLNALGIRVSHKKDFIVCSVYFCFGLIVGILTCLLYTSRCV